MLHIRLYKRLVLVPCGGNRKSPRTSPQCRLYFISFEIIGPNCGILENGVLLMYTQEGVSNVANEESQLNQDSHFLFRSLFIISEGNVFDVYYTNKYV